MDVPGPNRYPQIQANYFKSPVGALNNIIQGNAAVKRTLKHAEIYSNLVQCTLTLETPLFTEIVDGHGSRKTEAELAAHLHLYAKLHAAGNLAVVLDSTSSINTAGRSQQRTAHQEQKDSIADIYNYCARFDTTPTITHRQLTGRSRKAHFLTSIELADQNIRVDSTGRREASFVRAALKFKAAAEKYQIKQSDGSLVIKDSNALTVDNAPHFIEFLKIVRPGVTFSTEFTPVPQSDFHRAQLRLNDQLVGEPVELPTKKKAESIAMLILCVQLKKQNPDLWPRFRQALRAGHGQILKPIAPVDFVLSSDCGVIMRETLLAARRAGLPDTVEAQEARPDDSEGFRRGPRQPMVDVEARSKELQSKHAAFEADDKFRDIRQKKADLPMNQYRAKVLDLVNQNVYSIVVGSTGSGKTTQVPQILLEAAVQEGQGAKCNIICTQPRRIAATSVSRRVAQERGERLQDTVGYHVRFDSKLPRPGGSINYCTTGILLQQLQRSPDEVMDQHSHLVIDEVHERDTLIDFLLILLKKNVHRRVQEGRPVPRVVLMSATMDTELFANYFRLNDVPCPSISVPGRAFPVREKYVDEILQDMREANTPMMPMQADPNTRKFLEIEDRFKRSSLGSSEQTDRSVIDWKQEKKMSSTGEMVVADEKDNAVVPMGLVAATVAHIARTTGEGAILVFLPGLEEIVKVNEMLKSRSLGVDLTDETHYKVYMLHSSIAHTQSTIFEAVPAGCRKIILSTNIAETSVTIPDVQYVVDTGKLREKQYDSIRRITTLACTWVSKSNSKQRAGRAGRVQNGNYYALFTQRRYDSLRAIGLPELLRTDLQETCLDIKAQAFSMPIREFLADALEPPAPAVVDSSVDNLQMLDALSEEENITPLGRLLAALPVHPSLGKMIVLGIIFRCLDPMLILGAASAERDIFVQPLDHRDRARERKAEFAGTSRSDHIALLKAVGEMRQRRTQHGEHAMKDYGHRNFLHANAFSIIDATARQIQQVLVDSGLIPVGGDPSLNKNSHCEPLIKALLLAGLHPNLAVTPYGSPFFRTAGEKNVMLHPSSCNAPARRKKGVREELPRGQMYTYGQLAKSSDGHNLYMRDTSDASPLMALLFGGRLQPVEERPNIIEVNEWLPLFVKSTDRRGPKTVQEFRKALDRLLTVAFNGLGQLTKRRSRDAKTYLADEQTRETFASGLVDVLERDQVVPYGRR